MKRHFFTRTDNLCMKLRKDIKTWKLHNLNIKYQSKFFSVLENGSVQVGELLPCKICGRTFFPVALVSTLFLWDVIHQQSLSIFGQLSQKQLCGIIGRDTGWCSQFKSRSSIHVFLPCLLIPSEFDSSSELLC